MLVKIVRQQLIPGVVPDVLISLNLEIDQMEEFVNQIKNHEISWETTNVTFKFISCEYTYYPTDDKNPFYFKIIVE